MMNLTPYHQNRSAAETLYIPPPATVEAAGSSAARPSPSHKMQSVVFQRLTVDIHEEMTDEGATLTT